MTKKERKRKKKLQMKNKRLIKKYYFVMPHDWRGMRPKDYDFTWTNWEFPNGWNKAFGMQFLKELGDEIKRINQKDFVLLELKEKYGQLRCYTSGTSNEVDRIIEKYEFISGYICMQCGVIAPMINEGGWLSVYCYNCYKKMCRMRKQFCGVNDQSTEKKIKEQYMDCICDKDFTYDIPSTYTIHHYSKDGNHDETIDISDTVNRIKKSQSKWIIVRRGVNHDKQ